MVIGIFIEIMGTIIIFSMAVALLNRFSQIDQEFREFFVLARKDVDILSETNEKIFNGHNRFNKDYQDIMTVCKSLSSRLDKINELAAERWEMLEREKVNEPTNEFKGAFR